MIPILWKWLCHGIDKASVCWCWLKWGWDEICLQSPKVLYCQINNIESYMVQTDVIWICLCVPCVLLEIKAHGHQGKKTWFGSDFVSIVHDSIIAHLWFLLQMSKIPPTSLTWTVRYLIFMSWQNIKTLHNWSFVVNIQ